MGCLARQSRGTNLGGQDRHLDRLRIIRDGLGMGGMGVMGIMGSLK